MGLPRDDRERKFCERWLVHFDHVRAWREAGYKFPEKNSGSHTARAVKLLERLSPYLKPFQEAKAREIAKKMVVDDEQVLLSMSRKAVFDPGDFVETAATPKTRVFAGDDGKEKTETVEWYGKPVFAARLKPFHELTPEQRMSVEIVGDSGGEVRYRLPDVKEQHQYLTSIGRQFGMFLEKLITERHYHRHSHAHLDLKEVPTAELQQLTKKLLPYVGQEYASQLGFTPEDIEDARKASDLVAANGKA